MRANDRMERLLLRLRFKVKKVRNRNDILSVQYRNHHLFTLPKVIHTQIISEHKTREGMTMPDFFDREQTAKTYDLRARQTPYLQEKESLEKEQNETS